MEGLGGHVKILGPQVDPVSLRAVETVLTELETDEESVEEVLLQSVPRGFSPSRFSSPLSPVPRDTSDRSFEV